MFPLRHSGITVLFVALFSLAALACAHAGPLDVAAQVTVAEGDAKLHVQRDLVVKKHVFPVFNYPTVKSFFDEVTAGDEELVVLSAVKK